MRKWFEHRLALLNGARLGEKNRNDLFMKHFGYLPNEGKHPNNKEGERERTKYAREKKEMLYLLQEKGVLKLPEEDWFSKLKR